MKKHVVTDPGPGEMGYGCRCGIKRFATRKDATAHADTENAAETAAELLRQAKVEVLKIQAAEAEARGPQPAATEVQPEAPQGTKTEEPATEPAKPAKAVQTPPDAPKPVQTGEIVTRGTAMSIANMEMADQMVLKYASNLINSEAAAEFQTRMKLIQRLNPKLAQVSPQSLFMAMMACVHLRLMPNTTEQLAFIIPYGNEAQFQIGYKGLAELAYRTGNVIKIDQEAVFEGDEFEWSLGVDRKLVHKPSPLVDRTQYNKLIATYATALMKDGSTLFEVVTKAELDKIKAFAKAKAPDAPWNQWPIEQSKKTATKRLGKLIPKSSGT